MRTAVTHQRVSEDVSVDRVNRENREQHGDRARGESAGRTGQSAGQVWRNIGSLRTLLARAERELVREPGAYVAVAVVHGDKREEQAGRWGWAGTADTGGKVADIGNRLVGDARGLRVRAHHDGGRLLGSVLLRRARHDVAPEVVAVTVTDAMAERRLAALEAKLTQALGQIQEQDREIRSLRGEVARVEHCPNALGNMHRRLDAVEAVCERMEDAEAKLREGEEEEETEEEEKDDDEEDEEQEEDEQYDES